jgi:hypothetical protein
LLADESFQTRPVHAAVECVCPPPMTVNNVGLAVVVDHPDPGWCARDVLLELLVVETLPR